MKRTNSGNWKVESGEFAGDLAFRLSSLPFRPAMTLIELMVVIVILVTLVAGVLPLVSPNNDARKIADAGRSLQTYFAQAQAEAARLGRPVGIGFRESAPGSGVALAAFQLAVPKPFAGLDPNARVRILFPVGNYGTTGADPKGGTQFTSLYEGELIYRLQFVKGPLYLKDGSNEPDYLPDPYPDGMFKIGDVINLEGNEFLIIDDEGDQGNQSRLRSSDYYQSDQQDANPLDGFLWDRRGEVHCIWINNFGQQPPKFKYVGENPPPNEPGDVRTYRVHRQPATGDKFAPSPEAAYQLPTGVAIDLQASGVEGLGEPETFAENGEIGAAAGPIKQIGIMFSPHGGIDGVWVNDSSINTSSTSRSGNKLTSVARIFLMLGRVENQNPTGDLYNLAGNRAGGVTDNMSDDELREIRSKVNWLNPDSRWLVINTQNGRVEVGQNAVYDLRDEDLYEVGQVSGDARIEAIKIAQIEAAHGDSHGHQEDPKRK
jgi:prepilin-type N-terminal cleavage/methylation domain-containing protein